MIYYLNVLVFTPLDPLYDHFLFFFFLSGICDPIA